MEIVGRNVLQSLLTLPGEVIVIAKRRHWFTLVAPIFITIFILSGIYFLIFFFSLIFAFSPVAILTIIITILTISLSTITKVIVDWYYHLYVVTNRKILEIYYDPLFSHTISDVLLDQVRCTEIDVRIKGIINEILDKGDIIVTFDRPTHTEEFAFTNLKNPREIGQILGDAFAINSITQAQNLRTIPIWYQNKNNQENGKRKFTYFEDYFPNRITQLN